MLRVNTMKKVKILSVDGGGVKGVISARIIQELEHRTKKHASELFDIAAGTSTGGIIILGLATPNQKGVPKYYGKDILNLYLKHAANIFKKSILRKFITGFGIWGAKYDRSELDSLLNKTFGNLLLSQTIYPVYVPIYSIDTSKPYIANTMAAKANKQKDFYVKDIAGATSAAPTYFAPKMITNLQGSLKYTTADGGTYANDPELIAGISTLSSYPNYKPDQIILISIGAGEIHDKAQQDESNNGILGWLKEKNLVENMIDAEVDLDETLASRIFAKRYRLEVGIPSELEAMDDSSTEHLQKLIKRTEGYIASHGMLIDEICGILTVNDKK